MDVPASVETTSTPVFASYDSTFMVGEAILYANSSTCVLVGKAFFGVGGTCVGAGTEVVVFPCSPVVDEPQAASKTRKIRSEEKVRIRMIDFLSGTYDDKSIVPERLEERGDMTRIRALLARIMRFFRMSREEEQKIRDTGGYDW